MFPFIEGAEFPLLNSKEETERWEALYGKFEYKGAGRNISKRNGRLCTTSLIIRRRSCLP